MTVRAFTACCYTGAILAIAYAGYAGSRWPLLFAGFLGVFGGIAAIGAMLRDER